MTGPTLRESDRWPGVWLGDDVEIGDDTALAPTVVVFSGTRIGPRCSVESGASLGKGARLGPYSSTVRDAPPPLVVEEDVSIGTGSVVFAGARIGARSIVGDQAFVRERATLGADTVIGRGSVVENDARIGDRVRINTLVYLTAGTVVEDDVFVAPGVVTTNDNTMTRGMREDLHAPILRRACRVGGGAVILPGIEIGEEAFVAAGAVVTRDVEPRGVVMGLPATNRRTVPDSDLLRRRPKE
jgi:acetyltransferase-like isoleucine patch superfamily enzyme